MTRSRRSQKEEETTVLQLLSYLTISTGLQISSGIHPFPGGAPYLRLYHARSIMTCPRPEQNRNVGTTAGSSMVHSTSGTISGALHAVSA